MEKKLFLVFNGRSEEWMNAKLFAFPLPTPPPPDFLTKIIIALHVKPMTNEGNYQPSNQPAKVIS